MTDLDKYKVGCTLQAYGRNFDVESFWQQTVFDSESLIFKGSIGSLATPQPTLSETTPFENEYLETKWLMLLVSRAGHITNQEADAVVFLSKYREEIRRLADEPNVELLKLHFDSVPVAIFPSSKISRSKSSRKSNKSFA